MGKFIDLTGQRFGRLTVIERAENNKHGHVRWLCQCDCGNKKKVDSDCLRNGETQSCGCRKLDNMTIHGQSRSRIYRIWSGIKSRCCNPNDANFHLYGGRGIQICSDWKNSFETFCEWSMAHGYNDTLTIDRIDVDGNYCPSNCRWATYAEQLRNTRNTHMITYNGKTQCVTDWAKELHMSQATLFYRIQKGWPIEKALTLPINKNYSRTK